MPSMYAGDFVQIVKVEGFNYREPGLPGDIARLWRPLIKDGRFGWVIKLELDGATFWVDARIIRRIPPPEPLLANWQSMRNLWIPDTVLRKLGIPRLF